MSILGVESIVQTDSPYFTNDQLCDHEAGHQFFFLDGTAQRTDLYNRCKTAYEQATTPEQRKQLLRDYLAKYEDIYDGADTEIRQDALYNQVIEEILCDAYAGMNRDGAGADQFQSVVKPIIDEWCDQRDAENRTRTEARRNSKNDVRENGGTRYSPEGARDAYAGKSLREDSSVYSYEFLTSLPDMKVTALPDVDAVRDSSGKVDPRTEADGEYSYVLFGLAERKDGKQYLVKSTVNHFAENKSIVDSVEIYDILKGIKARKTEGRTDSVTRKNHALTDNGTTLRQREADSTDPASAGSISGAVDGSGSQGSHTVNTAARLPNGTASTISVSQLLDVVKENYPELLPDSVREHYGITGPEKAPGARSSREFTLSRLLMLL